MIQMVTYQQAQEETAAMKRNMKTTMIVTLSLLGLAACGGGGGGGDGGGGGGSSSSSDTGPSLASMQGTWYGAYQISTTAYTLGVDVNNASGNISALRRNGTSLGLTGSLSKDHGNIFDFSLIGGTTGGFYADNSATHVAFLESTGQFGVLQKGASALPTYAPGDLVGTWSGYTVAVDSNMTITREGPSSATVSLTRYIFSGSDINGAFSGSFSATGYDANYGWFQGTWSNNTSSGSLRAWLSVDKTFAAVWACNVTTSYVYALSSCTYSAWRKQ
jgi:hypothetical protein